MKKKIPEFKNEDDEWKFWTTADSTDYTEWRSAKRRKLVHLKPSR
jgi:CopG antitoxin of type II toxin-antitoxin system